MAVYLYRVQCEDQLAEARGVSVQTQEVLKQFTPKNSEKGAPAPMSSKLQDLKRETSRREP